MSFTFVFKFSSRFNNFRPQRSLLFMVKKCDKTLSPIGTTRLLDFLLFLTGSLYMSSKSTIHYTKAQRKQSQLPLPSVVYGLSFPSLKLPWPASFPFRRLGWVETITTRNVLIKSLRAPATCLSERIPPKMVNGAATIAKELQKHTSW